MKSQASNLDLFYFDKEYTSANYGHETALLTFKVGKCSFVTSHLRRVLSILSASLIHLYQTLNLNKLKMKLILLGPKIVQANSRSGLSH